MEFFIKIIIDWKPLFSQKATTQIFDRGLITLLINPLNAKPTKWSNTLKQFVGNSRQIVWVRLTILWGLRLKG